MRKLGLLLLVALFFLAGCSKNDGGYSGDWNLASVRNLPITDAEALFIANDKLTKADGEGNGEEYHLYKITYNGQAERVEFTDGEGKKIPAQTVALINLSEKYIYIQMKAENQVCELIARKTDGAVYIWPSEQGANLSPFYFNGSTRIKQADLLKHIIQVRSKVQVDQAENVYVEKSGRLMKITDEGGGDTRIEILTGEHLLVKSWFINPNGDILFSTTDDSRFCRFKSGAYEPIDYLPVSNMVFAAHPGCWYGLQQSIYYDGPVDDEQNKFEELVLCRFDPRASSQDVEVVTSLLRQFSDLGSSRYGMCPMKGYYAYFYPLEVVTVHGENDIRFHKLDRKIENNITVATENYCYGLGGDNPITRIDPLSGHIETIGFDTGKYLVLSCYAGLHDEIILLTLELGSGNEVLFEISADGTVTNLETYDGHQVLVLERIK